MRQQEPGLNGLLGPLELIDHFPGEPCAASDRRRWVGLEALRYRDQPPNEAFQPPLTHHSLVLLLQTPKEFELHCDGVNRVAPPRAGSILAVPAGSSARWRWSSHTDSLHVFLEPGLVAQVAAEAFELDPARASVQPLDGLDLPQLRAAMLAVNDELTTDAAGGALAAESLANLLAVHLIRNASAPRPVGRTARSRRRSSAPSSSSSRNISRRASPWSRWRRWPISASTTSRGSSRRAPACRPTSTSWRVALRGRSSSCNKTVTSPWQRSRHAPASRIKANSAVISSASSASRRNNFAGPQAR